MRIEYTTIATSAISLLTSLFSLYLNRKNHKEANSTSMRIESSLVKKTARNDPLIGIDLLTEGKTIYIKYVNLVSAAHNPFRLSSSEALISGLSSKNRLESGEPSGKILFSPTRLMTSYFDRNETFLYRWVFYLFCRDLAVEVETTNGERFYRKASKEIRSWLWDQYKNDPRTVAR